MPETEVNAEDVLKRYAEAMEALKDNAVAGAVEDVSALAHPKPVIRATLAHFVTLSSEAELSEWLKTAFMTLARFQELSADERAAIAWKSQDQATAQEPQAQEHSKTYLRLMARISGESGELRANLGGLKVP